jgi:hypothetical protein
LAALTLAPLILTTLALLDGSLIHQVQHPKIMLGVLQVSFRHNAVATARRIPAQLQIFLEQLLRRSANPNVGTIAVEHVVPVERNAASGMVAHAPAATVASTTIAAAAAGAMVAATHAFHVHSVAVLLSRCGAAWGVLGPPSPGSRG